MTKLALYVPLQAKPGKEKEVADFLRSALPLVNAEPGTISWFAIQEGPSAFAIFDTFDDEAGRDAHLNGKVAAALMEKAKAGDLFPRRRRSTSWKFSRTNFQNERPLALVVAISAATQQTTRVPDRMGAGPENGPTPKRIGTRFRRCLAISRRGARRYRFGSDLSDAEASEPLFLGFSSPRAVSRAANPAATTAAVAAFFATCLSFVPARRGVIFFAFRAVFAFVVFLAFDLAAARFDVDLAVFDLVLLLLLVLVFDFPRLTAFFMMPPA